MKRKKHDRLPNGYGEIRYLGPGRKNCYAVHPPATTRDEHGQYIKPKPLCYTDDWYTGLAVLTSYHAGTYKPGDELTLKSYRNGQNDKLDEFCDRMLSDYYATMHATEKMVESQKTFADVYEMFYDWKYGEHAARKFSEQYKRETHSAYMNLSPLHNMIFRDIRLEDLQACLNNCSLKKGSINLMRTLLVQIYKFAEPRDLCDRNYAHYLSVPDAEENTHGIPFTDEELETFWKHKDDPVIEMILIMCYSGFRIAAYTDLKVNLEEGYFRGGVKTSAGKDRIVPIHSAIDPLVRARIARDGGMLTIAPAIYRNRMYKALEALGIEKHTPHDCRHTFSRLCEKYGVREADRKRMMGHSFGSDITNGIYGHRTLEDLRTEIEKIQVPFVTICDH